LINQLSEGRSENVDSLLSV